LCDRYPSSENGADSLPAAEAILSSLSPGLSALCAWGFTQKPLWEPTGGHGFDHSERVLKLARKIAADERKKGKKTDFLVLEAACLLHDAARGLEESGECSCHAEKGAELAEKILLETGFPADKIEAAKHCILVHRYSKNKKAESLEAKILQDADRLDVLGAIAIARTIEFGARSGRPVYDPSKKPKKKYDGDSETAINHLKEKILAIKPGTFHTSLARKLARRRYLFVEKFVEEFEAEWSGGK